MTKIELPAPKLHPSFIGAWSMQNAAVCDEIVDFFNSGAAQQMVGVVGEGVMPSVKNSVDITIEPNFLSKPEYSPFNSYLEELQLCYEQYKIEWPFLTKFLEEVHVGAFTVQRYLEGGHFKGVHAERMGLGSSHRLLAWMTYLNDVESGGNTAFTHYGIEVTPQKGLTLIWPAEWTHAHFGDVVMKGEKYIITGHFHLPPVPLK